MPSCFSDEALGKWTLTATFILDSEFIPVLQSQKEQSLLLLVRFYLIHLFLAK
jgi:hypothetical protein